MNAIKQLNIEKGLFIVFILISILSIYADTLQQYYIKTNNQKYNKQAKSLFITTLIITLIIYSYFLYRNYNQLKDALLNNKNIFNNSIRTFGSILIIVATLCFIYFQLNNTDEIGISEI